MNDVYQERHNVHSKHITGGTDRTTLNQPQSCPQKFSRCVSSKIIILWLDHSGTQDDGLRLNIHNALGVFNDLN